MWVLAALLLAGGCREEDPLARLLARRSHYTVEVVSFSARGEDRILAELEVRANMGSGLDRLTATVRQHDAEGAVLRQDQITLDLSAMDATGVLRLYSEVPAAPGEVAGLSALVEREPPASEYGQFPEIQAAAGG